MPPLPTEADIDRLLAQVDLAGRGGGGGDDDRQQQQQQPGGENDLMPMMEQMMQTLLSKDLLYPAVRDLAERYPEWLADNRDALTEQEFDRWARR